MRKLVVLFAIAMLSIPVFAQDEVEDIETLFGSQEIEVNGWGGPEVKLCKYHGEWGVLLGGKGGTLLNKTFGIGGAGYILMTSHELDNYIQNVSSYTERSSYLRDIYGGLFLEYINSSNRVIHFTATALVGAGMAAYTESLRYSHHYDNDNWVDEASAYFVFEPGLTVDINMTTYFRLSFGAGYRLISGLDLPVTESKDIGGLTAFVTFKFGDF